MDSTATEDNNHEAGTGVTRSMDLLQCLGAFFLLTAFAVDVVCVASQEWAFIPGVIGFGLWSKCASNGYCTSTYKSDKLDGVRGVMVVGVCIAGLALLVVLMDITSIWINQRTNRLIVRMVAAATFFSALMTLIGVLLSREVHWDDRHTQYGYSFWLGVAAIVLLFISGVLFLASAIRYHQARKRRKSLLQKSSAQKKYPFTIPHYDYKSEQNESNGQSSTDLDDDRKGRLTRNSEMYPYHFQYRYHPTSFVSRGSSRRDGSSVANEVLNIGRYSSGSGLPITQFPGVSSGSGLPITHLPGNSSNFPNPGYISDSDFQTRQLPDQQLMSINNKASDYQRSVYDRLQPRMGTDATIMSRPIRTAALTPSVYAASSVLGRSKTSSRVPRDDCGFPLNYNIDD